MPLEPTSAPTEAVIFDLEFTAWEGSHARGWSQPGEHREVIQIGAVRLETVHARERAAFQTLVRPTINPMLSTYVQDLTGITQSAMDCHGTAFEDALQAFLAFVGTRPLFCFGWDEVVIEENIRLRTGPRPCGLLRATNLHAFFRENGVEPAGTPSGCMAERVGAPIPPGQPHDALHDCRSLGAAVRHLIAAGARSPLSTPDATFGP